MAARALVEGGLPVPAGPLEPSDSSRDYGSKGEGSRWKAQILAARQLAGRGHYGKALQRIIGSGLAKMTPEVIDSLERCFTHNSSPIPRCPADAPPIFVESSKLHELIREGADGQGWPFWLDLRTLASSSG